VVTFARRSRCGLLVLSFLVTAASAAAAPGSAVPPPNGEVTVASIPLFARLASDAESLHAYQAPVRMSGSVHKFFFTFHFEREGKVTFEQPASLQYAFDSVPQKYSNMFNQLGTPRTWPAIFDLQCVKATTGDNGATQYEIHGIPKDSSSDIDHVVIRMSDQDGPIIAEWILRDGWDVTSTIQMESVDNYLLPKEENTDVTGHGFHIHSDGTYGAYDLKSAA
jgi:hypothetical protein